MNNLAALTRWDLEVHEVESHPGQRFALVPSDVLLAVDAELRSYRTGGQPDPDLPLKALPNPSREPITERWLHDLGNLLDTCRMLWAVQNRADPSRQTTVDPEWFKEQIESERALNHDLASALKQLFGDPSTSIVDRETRMALNFLADRAQHHRDCRLVQYTYREGRLTTDECTCGLDAAFITIDANCAYPKYLG